MDIDRTVSSLVQFPDHDARTTISKEFSFFWEHFMRCANEGVIRFMNNPLNPILSLSVLVLSSSASFSAMTLFSDDFESSPNPGNLFTGPGGAIAPGVWGLANTNPQNEVELTMATQQVFDVRYRRNNPCCDWNFNSHSN